jgi:hypothetical protein
MPGLWLVIKQLGDLMHNHAIMAGMIKIKFY